MSKARLFEWVFRKAVSQSRFRVHRFLCSPLEWTLPLQIVQTIHSYFWRKTGYGCLESIFCRRLECKDSCHWTVMHWILIMKSLCNLKGCKAESFTENTVDYTNTMQCKNVIQNVILMQWQVIWMKEQLLNILVLVRIRALKSSA